MGDTGTTSETATGGWRGYSPLRRAVRGFRPAWASRLTQAGRANWRFVSEHGHVVLHGPFAGLDYPPGARGHVGFLGAKILGTYERELHGAVEDAIARGFDHLVDIGSGEGFYVVGLARRMGPGTRVSAFELDAGESALCTEMAERNGVDAAVTQCGECSPERLREILTPGALVISDVEGYEMVILDPEAVPELLSATVLVELHPQPAPDVEQVVTGRFAATHDIQVIRQEERVPGDYEELRGWDPQAAFLLVSEGWLTQEQWAASGRCWAYMTPRPTA